MPIYEYVCRDCGEQFEWLTRGGQTASCPSCGQKELEKQLSVPAAHTGRSAGPECPARESGACGVADCHGSNCNMGEWG